MNVETPIDSYLDSASKFLLEMPLYYVVELTDVALNQTWKFIRAISPVDAYCVYCQKSSTFVRSEADFDFLVPDGW